MVTAPVRNGPVIHATSNPALNRATIFYMDCEDTLNVLGNCYECKKPGHGGETAQRKPKLKPKLRAAITEDRAEKLSALTATRKGTWPGIAGDPRRIKDKITPWKKRR